MFDPFQKPVEMRTEFHYACHITGNQLHYEGPYHQYRKLRQNQRAAGNRHQPLDCNCSAGSRIAAAVPVVREKQSVSIGLLESVLEFEYCSYDAYRTLANLSNEKYAARVLLSICLRQGALQYL
jgi:hypothetical protein